MPYSPATGLPIESQTVSQMVDRVLELEEGTRLYLLAPIVRGRKGEYRKELAELMKKGFQRVKIDGQFYEIAEAPALDKKFTHDIDVVVDRLVVRDDIATRLADSLETALALTDGVAIAELADKPLDQAQLDSANMGRNETHERIIFSARFACPVSGFTIDEIEPRLFSFNNPYGACPSCDGLGTELRFEPDLVVPDGNLSLRQGAIVPWAKTGATSPYYAQTLEAIAAHYKVKMSEPWNELPEHVRDAILFGSGEEAITFTYEDGTRSYTTTKPFEGVINNIQRRWQETESNWVRDELSRYQSDHPCQACEGYRLKPQALAVKIADLHIGQVTEMSIRAAGAWFDELPDKLNGQAKRDRHAHPQGDPRAAEVPQRRGARLSHPVARLAHAVGRREPAHPPRQPDRLRPYGRALRAGRTLHRPAPARQRPAAGDAQASARPRQHGDRGRA